MQEKLRVVPKDPRLEDRLILAKYVASQIGLDSSDLTPFCEVKEGFDATGRSYMYHQILSQNGLKLSEAKLREYDDNIRRYLEKLKKNRGEELQLRYFQYLGLLFTELYLDRFFSNSTDLANELTEFCGQVEPDSGQAYSPGDIRKVAYWMATGSGKTLIMHVNYWQFMHYAEKYGKADFFDNVLLVTPSEKMTEQHLRELEKSGIPAQVYSGLSSPAFESTGDRVVKVIEIHKLKLPEDKKGQGVSVPVSRFGDKNLVLVDEGHKGQKSEDQKWKRVRTALGEEGFTFEYSATFSQAIGPKDKEAMSEYSRAIILDYSYRFFYGDGFGKDFQVINLKETEFSDRQRNTLLLANAMAYYEQIRSFQRLGESERKAYGFELPLWVFVGSKVNKDDTSEEIQSDILKVVNFFSWLASEKRSRIESDIQSILSGSSGLLDPDNQDVFRRQEPELNFRHLRGDHVSASSIYEGIFESIFKIRPGTSGNVLHLVPIRSAEGEIGLKIGAAKAYFGLIDIGSRNEFLEIVRTKAPNVLVESADSVSGSLFTNLDFNDDLKVLIGAKKFIEGWDCHRVSTMGLLDIGKGEGAQIIQLFGRGVRLKGFQNSMKRSTSFQNIAHPREVSTLENLRIFGISADYMLRFKEILDQERIQEYVELTPPVVTKPLNPFPSDLFVLRLKPGASFKAELLELNPEKYRARVDILPRADSFSSQEGGLKYTSDSEFSRTLDEDVLNLVDWDEIYLELLEYKRARGFDNILVTKDKLKEILYKHRYDLVCLKEQIAFDDFTDYRLKIREVVLSVLRNYLNVFNGRERVRWEKDTDNLEKVSVKKEDDGMIHDYRIYVAKEKQDVLAKIVQSIKSKEIYAGPVQMPGFENVYLGNHLYQPLLANVGGEIVKTKPNGLNEGEKKFVLDLGKWLAKNATRVSGLEVYLMRNLTKGRGVGFFEENSFYPDFILWMKQKNGDQKVVFIDPKGMVFTDIQGHEVELHNHLKTEISPKFGGTKPTALFDSFIVSITPFDKLQRDGKIKRDETCEKVGREKHVLFQYSSESVENTAYIDEMFKLIGH